MFHSCRACAGPVRASAEQCPHCGALRPVTDAPAAATTDDGLPDVRRRRRREQAPPPEVSQWQLHFDRGLESISQQDYPSAIAALSQAIVEAPDHEVGKCYASRGYAQLCLNQLPQAIDDCSQAIDFDPSDGEAFAWRGSAYAGEQRWRLAIEDYLVAIRLSPDSAHDYQQIAAALAQRACADLTNVERAKRATAETYQDRAVMLQFLQQYEPAIRDYSHAIKLNHGDAVSHVKRAECHAALGHFDRVYADCKAAMSLGVRTPAIYLQRGIALAHLGQAAAAIADFTKVLELDPYHAAVLFERGRLRQAQKEYKAALADISAAIELTPHEPQYYATRAVIGAALGKHEAAAEDYSLALQYLPGDVPLLLSLGGELVACGRLEEALVQFDTALTYDTACAPAFRGRGLVFFKSAQFDQAVTELSKAIRLNARYAAAYATRGEVFLGQQRYDQAIADLTKGIEFETAPLELAATHYHRGLAYLDAGKPDRAAADFDQSLTHKPLDPPALAWRGSARGHLRNWRAAIDDIALALVLDPKERELYEQLGRACAEAAVDDLDLKIENGQDTAANFLDRATAYDFLNEAQTALYDYNAAIKLAPQEVEGYVRRGRLLARNGKHEHAVADFSRALKLDAQHAKALHGRGLSLAAIGKRAEALADLTAAIALDDSSATLRRDRAQLLVGHGKQEEALPDYTRALELDPRAVELHFERGQALAALGKHDAAIADFDALLEAKPGFVKGLVARGEAYVATKRFKKALGDFDAAIVADPKCVPAHSSRGLTLARIGQQDQAILDLTKAAGKLKQDVAFAGALAARAKVYYSIARFSRAAFDYACVIRLKPPGQNLAHMHYGRGLAQLQQNDLPGAEKSFAKAAELNPQFRPARTALTWIRGDKKDRPAELRAPETKFKQRKPPVVAPAVIVDVSKSAQWQVESLWDQWIVRTPEGLEFGPVQKVELDRWCGEGRIHPSYWLLRLDWDDWRAAGEIYFELAFETLRSSNRPVPVSMIPDEPVEEVEEYAEVEETVVLPAEAGAANPSPDFDEFAKQFGSKPADPGDGFPGIKF